jgi:hypothetical protein
MPLNPVNPEGGYDPMHLKPREPHSKASGKNNTDQLTFAGMPPAMIRKVLVNHGYDVDKTGPMTLRLRAAMMNARSTNGGGSDKWNKLGPQRGEQLKKVGGAIVRVHPVNPEGHVVEDGKAPAGKVNPKTGKPLTDHGPTTKPDPKADPTPTPQTQTKADISLTAKVPHLALTDPAAAKIGKLLDPAAYGENQAGLAYDSQINEANRSIGSTQSQGEQNQADIGHWFDQVLGSLKTAGGRDSAATKAGVGSVNDATAAILASLGGQANSGSSTVGAAGADAAGTLQALGTAEDQYNSDLAPLLQAEGAGDKARNQAQTNQSLEALRNKVIDLQGDRGKAKAAGEMDAQQQNNALRSAQFDRLMAIRGQNNAARQTTFGDEATMDANRTAALINGIKATASLVRATKTKGPKTFADAGSSAHQDAFNQGVAGLQGAGKPAPQAVQFIRNLLNGYGWSFHNPAVQTLAGNIASKAGYKVDPRSWAPLG